MARRTTHADSDPSPVRVERSRGSASSADEKPSRSSARPLDFAGGERKGSSASAASDPLGAYNAKRDFARTAEPPGERAPAGGHLFIVQKHDATRLHWDFRLEMDGVLKSWAVTKGPSLDPADKRLAVRTEDHPLSYASFEGTIPKGEYGGGTVMLWDEGTWAPVGGKDPARTIDEGHVHVRLTGERMKGEWLLVRMKPRPGEKRENWLLRKIDDAAAGAGGALVDRCLTSVKTGRTMSEIANGDSAVWHSDRGKDGPGEAAAPSAPRRKPGSRAASAASGAPGPRPAPGNEEDADGVAAVPPRKRGSRAASAASGAPGPRPAPGNRQEADAEETAAAPPPVPRRKRGSRAASASPAASRSSPRSKEPGPLPAFRDVQLATLVDHVPDGTGWLHEVKFDGYRALLAVGGGEAKAYTRHGLDWSDRFAAICAAARDLAPHGALIDGEVVALDKDGKPNFSALQAALSEGGGELHYFAFDLLEQGGEDLTGLGTLARKERLEALLQGAAPPIHYAEHILSSGEALFGKLCAGGYEGVVSKQVDAPYRGRRTRAWLKIKCTHRQEFVILGFTASDKAGRSLRSLALAVNEGGRLRYAGRVGTGFDAKAEAMLIERLRPLVTKAAAADVPRAAARGTIWVEPRLVAEVAFAEFTAEGVVRHATFLGLREDKGADEVVAEVAAPAPAPPAADGAPFGVAITHPDRVIYPESGTTKGELVAYYAALAEPMLRWLANRPVSLVRCPQGRSRHCFFQKHDAGSFGAHVGHVPVTEKDGSVQDYLVVPDAAGLLTCVQMGTIEFHGWGSPADDLEHPNRMVFDLDPDEGLDFADVRNAAVQLRDLLGEMGLVSFAMASGGKGVHVVVPLDRSADWGRVKDFASRFSRAVAEAHPKRFTANMRKVERRGRIFLDWLRNQRGATAVLPYSARARERAPVATPITWDELGRLETAHPYSIRDAAALLERARSRALEGWGEAEQALPDL